MSHFDPDKILAVSKDRYRATAEQRRLYGGKTVTEFYVYYARYKDRADQWAIVRGYGKTPADRKADAIRKFKERVPSPAVGPPSNLISALAGLRAKGRRRIFGSR